MPDHVTMFDWSDVENATGYEIQMAFGSAPEWVDIAEPSPTHGYRAYMNGSSALIETPAPSTTPSASGPRWQAVRPPTGTCSPSGPSERVANQS